MISKEGGAGASGHLRAALGVALLGVALVTALCVSILVRLDSDPTVFAAFGESSENREYVEELLGDVYLRPNQGHDGKFFFVQANDPLVLDPENNAQLLDRPLYRSQRMGYPLVASLFGTLPPEGVVWGMLITNIVAMGVGVFAVALISVALGGSPWWGMAFLLNIGFLAELLIDGAGILAGAAAFLAVLFMIRGQLSAAIAFLTVAALVREPMLIVAVGAGYWLWRQRRVREAVRTVAVPGLLVVAWAVYLRFRITQGTGISEVQEIGVPFRGVFEAFGNWAIDPLSLAVGIAMLLLMAIFALRTFASKSLLGFGFIGFVFLGLLFTKQVWSDWFDISRALAPLVTAYFLLAFVDKSEVGPTRIYGPS